MHTNDLRQYLSVRHLLRAGDVIVYKGASPLSLAIEALASGPSHSAVVRQPALSAGTDAVITESTRPIVLTAGSLNGVQTHPLGAEVAGYDAGGSIAALLLDDPTRARIDWKKFYAAIGSMDGIVTYDTAGLFEYLGRQIPIIGARLWQEEKQDSMFCSAFVSAVLIHCGALGAGINWSKQRPQELLEAHIYKGYVPLLGKPKLARFNTL
jgi:hypothetical protein